MEITNDGFEASLRALTEPRGSRYELKSFDAFAKGTNRRRAAYQNWDDYIANQSGESGPATRPLLVLATLSKLPYSIIVDGVRYSGKRRLEIDKHIPLDLSPSDDFIFEFLRDIAARPSEQEGRRPIRLLLWVLDRDKFVFLPRTTSGRTAVTMEVEEACQVQEIVGCGDQPYRESRPPSMDLRSTLNVVRRMHGSGLKLPADRQSRLYKAVVEDLESNLSQSDHTNLIQGEKGSSLEQDLATLEDQEIRWAFGALTFPEGTVTRKGRMPMNESNEISSVLKLRAAIDTITGASYRRGRSEPFLKPTVFHFLLLELERSIALQRPTHRLVEPATDATGGFVVRPPALDGADSGTLSIEDLVEMSPNLTQGIGSRRPQNDADNYSSLNRPKPLLMWDQRAFEPLEARADDFFPEHKLALVDLQVRRDFPSPVILPGGTPTSGSISRIPLVRSASRNENLQLQSALDRIAHGCAAALIPQCPSITDPLRGGRMSWPHLRVRMVTQEMWRELVEAWYRWPFRRGDEELEAEMGKSTVFIDYDSNQR